MLHGLALDRPRAASTDLNSCSGLGTVRFSLTRKYHPPQSPLIRTSRLRKSSSVHLYWLAPILVDRKVFPVIQFPSLLYHKRAPPQTGILFPLQYPHLRKEHALNFSRTCCNPPCILPVQSNSGSSALLLLTSTSLTPQSCFSSAPNACKP